MIFVFFFKVGLGLRPIFFGPPKDFDSFPEDEVDDTEHVELLGDLDEPFGLVKPHVLHNFRLH